MDSLSPHRAGVELTFDPYTLMKGVIFLSSEKPQNLVLAQAGIKPDRYIFRIYTPFRQLFYLTTP